MTNNLPSGTITFLLTDIEGSTRLWEAHPQAMRAALARHDVLLAEIIAVHGGHLFKHTGDGACAAFRSAQAALSAAVAAQRALLTENWGDTPLYARMALHSGEATAVGDDYYGQAVNRAARVMAAGHGGQIVLSLAASVLQEELPSGITLRDLGTHRLKDLQQPEGIFQVVGAGLREDFPPLRTLEAHPHNLPAQVTTFFGRETELAAVGARLDGARLVTLTGPGGTGKTRLALQVAAGRLERYRDGVWFVELASLREAGLVASTTAQALNLPLPPESTPVKVLTDYLAEKELLLVLDNCEHLLDGCAALVAEVLRACPTVSILATSRERLRVAGETLYPVPALALPGQDEALEGLTTYAAVQLFIDRGQAVQPAFQVTNANAPALAQVCAMLEGMPLAIELAAARLRSLSLESLAERLGDRFRLLTGGGRNHLPRHQTLRATIDWSHDLLTAPEQLLFRRLAVFDGGWSLWAAEGICADDALDTTEIFDLLESLVDKSLVNASSDMYGDTYYRMLETVREYAAAKLDTAGETTLLRDRHYNWFVKIAESVRYKHWHFIHDPNPDHGRKFWRFWKKCCGNFRAGLTHHSTDIMAEALAANHEAFASLAEAHEWLHRLLASDHGEPSASRAMALVFLGLTASRMHERVAYFDEAVTIWRHLGDTYSLARTLLHQGQILGMNDCAERAVACIAEGLAIARTEGNPRLLAGALQAYGVTLLVTGDIAGARPLLEESLTHARTSGMPMFEIAHMHGPLAHAAYLSDDITAAIHYAEEAISIFTKFSATGNNMNAYRCLGDARRAQGDFIAARTAYLTSMDGYWETDNVPIAYCALVRFGALAAAEHEFYRAVRYFATAEALRGDNFPLSFIEQREMEPALAAARAALSAAEYQAAWEAGAQLDITSALAICRAEEEAKAAPAITSDVD